jgi:hypothetical protein
MKLRASPSAVCAGLVLLLVAGAARSAPECSTPNGVPSLILNRIVTDASAGFGNLNEATCNAIVRDFVSTCRKQVKLAAQCNAADAEANLAIAEKQCVQIEAETERVVCKEDARTARRLALDTNETQKSQGLTACSRSPANTLFALCRDGLGPPPE